MIQNQVKQKLMRNWGEQANSLNCFAEVRVYDPLSSWECYIYAMNPDNENEIQCLISGGRNIEPITTEWTMYEISMLYNSHGEGVEIDEEYRPRVVSEILKKLEGR